MRKMADELPPLANPQRRQLLRGTRLDQRLDARASPPGGQLLVLLAQPATGTEQSALNHRASHSEPLADLAVGEALELAQNQHAVMVLGQSPERSAQVVEP